MNLFGLVSTLVVSIPYLVDVGVGIWFLVDSSDQKNFSYTLWPWCLGLCIVYILACISGLILNTFCYSGPISEIKDPESLVENMCKPRVIGVPMVILSWFGFFLWGCYIYGKLGIRGRYVRDGIEFVYRRHLWIWFSVNFWFITLIMLLVTFIVTAILFGEVRRWYQGRTKETPEATGK
jgi:hypothetical protein